MAKFMEKTAKINELTKEYIAAGTNKIKAHFMATEIVKYQDKFGVHMPAKMRNQLDKVGDYVSENHIALVKSGFSDKEARMAYDEGCELMLNKSDVHNVKTNVKQAQQQSKQQFEAFKNEHHNLNQNHSKTVDHEFEM